MPSVNIYVTPEDQKAIRKLVKRLREDRTSFSLWVCRQVRKELSQMDAAQHFRDILGKGGAK